MKISGVYKITNTITGDFYIGSSKDVKKRWNEHKCPSTWNEHPNKQLYQDMRKYGTNKFVFEVLEILEEVEIEKLRQAEQQFIETLKPTYNRNRADGWDVERRKKYKKEYNKTDKFKKYQKEYKKSDKYKEYKKKSNNKYKNQLCSYNGETLTLNALYQRFQRAGIEHPTIEAKKYLLNKSKDNIKGE